MDKAKNIAQGAWVTVIDPRKAAPAKLHVAAYARVSTDSEDQENSYIAQVDHYTRYIREHQGWELVDVYADEGLSGMETRRREEFNRMIADCREGKIDRILVKSISRFARNQEDFILYMRELLRLGISIRFEKENLDTGKISSEQVADIYGAFAQMETTSHSRNMRVSYRIQMERGIFVPAKAPYGYRLENRQLHIVPEEAEIVRYIFQEYLAGRGKQDLARELNARNVHREKGNGKWYFETIGYILSNPTYTGNQIWHKTYMTDTLPYVERRNTGQQPKYFAEECCPAIINKSDFEKVQELVSRRKETTPKQNDRRLLPGKKVFCASCGSSCRRKVSGTIVSWVCRKHNRDKLECTTKCVDERDLLALVQRFYHKMRKSREFVLAPMLQQLRELQERELRSDNRLADIDAELAKLTEQNLVLTRLKSKGYMDSALFLSETGEINTRVRELRKKRRVLTSGTPEEEVIRQTEEMLEYLAEGPEWLDTVDETVFSRLIDRIFLTAEDKVILRLHNGLEVEEHMERGLA